MNQYQIYSIRNSIIKNGEMNTIVSACKNNDFYTIQYILDYTIDKNILNKLLEFFTKEIIIFLYRQIKFDVNTLNDNKWNIFTFACFNNNLDLIIFLIKETNINTNLQDNIGFTPFMYACSQGHIDIVKYLYNKVNINVSDNHNKNALIIASSNGHQHIVEFLINFFDVNSKCIFSFTPLMYAIYYLHFDVIKILYNKSNIYSKNKQNKDCLLLAYDTNNIKIIYFLLYNELYKFNYFLNDLVTTIIEYVVL